MKAKKKISISYEIVSQNCQKAIVKGCKIFFDDSHSVTFLKRLVKVKNNLCQRADNDRFTDLMKEVKRANKWGHKQLCTDGNGLPYILKYSCSTTY